MPSFPSCVGGPAVSSSSHNNHGHAPKHPPHAHAHHLPQHRIDSPDNDSAFSDNASMLSSESSASSGRTALHMQHLQQQQVIKEV